MRSETNPNGFEQVRLRAELHARLESWVSEGGFEPEFRKKWLRDISAVKLAKWLTGRSIIPWWVSMVLEEGPVGALEARRERQGREGPETQGETQGEGRA